MACLIFEDGTDVVVAERGRTLRVVTKSSHHTAILFNLIETAVIRADPQGAALVLQDPGDLGGAQRVRIPCRVAQVSERAAFALPSVEAGLGADPHGS